MPRGGELVRRPSQEVAVVTSRELEVREKSSEELAHIQHELGKGAVSQAVELYESHAEPLGREISKDLVRVEAAEGTVQLQGDSQGLLQIEGRKKQKELPPAPTKEVTHEPIVVGHIDLSHNAERKAYDIADRRVEGMKEENSKRFLLNPKRIARNIWGYNAAHRKVLNQTREQIRQAQDVNSVDEEFDVDARKRYSEAIFNQFFNESDEAIDTSAKEDREFFEDDHEAAVAAKALYTEFARVGTEDSPAMTDDEFNERIAEVKRLMHENAASTATGEVVQDNYLEAARAIRGRIEHGEAIEDVLGGFELMRGEARSDARTEVHKNKTDEWLDRYERTRIGEIIPSNVAAVGIAAAGFLATRGAGALAKVAAFGGGAVVIGAMAAKRESVDIKKQRARRERETFRGKEFVDSTKHEQELSEFEHERVSADKLVESLTAFKEKLETDGFDEATIKASLDELANIQVLKDLSASEGIDLFDHGKSGDPTKHLQDRMRLAQSQAELKSLLSEAVDAGDTTVIEALGINPDELSDEYDSYDAVDAALDSRSSTFHEVKLRDISAKDEAFQKYRRRESLKKGAKAAAFSMVAGSLMQEVIAAGSSSSAGLIERSWGGNNSEAASNTILNGFDSGDNVSVTHIQENLSPERIAELKSQGSEVIANNDTTYETVTTSVNASEYAAAHPGEMRHFSEVNLFDNNTEVFDQNEQGGQLAREMDGSVRVWDTMAMDGSTSGEASIDMTNSENNVFSMAFKEPDGTYSHKVFEYGQSIDPPYADMLYEKDDGTWGFKGDGYVAWGQSSGESLDVAASIAGDGGPNTLTTTSEVPTVHYDYEIRTGAQGDKSLDVPPAVWSPSRSRIGNARRPNTAATAVEAPPSKEVALVPPSTVGNEGAPEPTSPQPGLREIEARPSQPELPPVQSKELEVRGESLPSERESARPALESRERQIAREAGWPLLDIRIGTSQNVSSERWADAARYIQQIRTESPGVGSELEQLRLASELAMNDGADAETTGLLSTLYAMNEANTEMQPSTEQPATSSQEMPAAEVPVVDQPEVAESSEARESTSEEVAERLRALNTRLDTIMRFYGSEAEGAGVTPGLLERARAVYEGVIRQRGADITDKSLARRAAAEAHPDGTSEDEDPELIRAINWINERLRG
ncbi:hypothetical protein I8H89_00055 [Candidatus Saccharibacteria bacterium]|nr:hypothetical protein [Candidatus Saccharibacteria bacterium]